MAIPQTIKDLANKVRTAVYGKDVRESLAKSMEETGNLADETKTRQDSLESQFQSVLDETTGKDVISAPEILAAQVGADGVTHSNLKERLDTEYNKVNENLAQKSPQQNSLYAPKIINLEQYKITGQSDKDMYIDLQNLMNNLDGGETIVIPPGNPFMLSQTIEIIAPDVTIWSPFLGVNRPHFQVMNGFIGDKIFHVKNYGCNFRNINMRGDAKTRGVDGTIDAIHYDRIGTGEENLDGEIERCTLLYVNRAVYAHGKNLKISRVLISQAKKGIEVKAVDGVSCYGIIIDGNRFHGVGGADYVGSAENDPNIVGENTGYCIYLPQDIGNMSFMEITNNTADTSGHFIYGKLPVFSQVVTNRVRDAWSTPIYLENASQVQINNFMCASGFTSKFTGHGIHLKNSSNNQIANVGINRMGGHGIYNESGSYNQFTEAVLIDNDFGDAGLYDGLNISSGSDNFIDGITARTTTGGLSKQRHGIYNAGTSTRFGLTTTEGNKDENLKDVGIDSVYGEVKLESIKTPTYQNGFTKASSNDEPTGYWKDLSGIAHLTGRVYNPSPQASGTIIYTLPEGYRPLGKINRPVITDSGSGSIEIGVDGVVKYLTGGLGWLSLSGISFRTV